VEAMRLVPARYFEALYRYIYPDPNFIFAAELLEAMRSVPAR